MVEAYTLKQDGRRIEAPSGNYQTQVNDGRNGGAPLLSDRTRISVVFPDLAVGDSVGLTYRIDDQEAMFPGQFSVVHPFSPYAVHEDSQITVRAAIRSGPTETPSPSIPVTIALVRPSTPSRSSWLRVFSRSSI